MKKKVTFGETLFAKMFNIVAGKDYLVAVQWDACAASRFFPLSRSLKNIFLVTAGILGLGLLCLTGEIGFWLHREIALQYHFKQNASLKTELRGVLASQHAVEASLDTLSHLEQRIRALYGMNNRDKSFLAFGVGGRRPETQAGQPFGAAVSEEILNSSLKNRQLQSKITFTSTSFRQIDEFVRYRHELWGHTPFVLPAKGQLTSGFGYRLHPVTGTHAMHEGLDIANSKWTPIYATADGIVTTSNGTGNFGNLVVIDHGNGYSTKYGHLTKLMVEKGQLVKRFGLVGYMGDTGRATGTHLHYEVHRDGAPQNPEKYILPSGVLVD